MGSSLNLLNGLALADKAKATSFRAILTGWLLLSMTASGSPASFPGADTLADKLAQIDQLIAQGHLDESLSRLEALEAQHSDDAGVPARIGGIHFKKNDYGKALDPLRKALTLAPQHKAATQYLGTCLYFLGRLEEAIPHLEKSLQWFPGNINYCNMLGSCYLQTNRPTKARIAFSKIFDVPQDSAQAFLIAGRMFRRAEIWDSAASLLQEALRRSPDLPMGHLYLGEVLLAQGKAQESIRQFRREIEINPLMWMGYYRTGEALLALGRGDEAVPLLERSNQLNKFFAGPHLLLGEILLRKNKAGESISHLQRAVQLDYNNSRAHYLLGRAFLLSGRREEAQREFDLSKQLSEANR